VTIRRRRPERTDAGNYTGHRRERRDGGDHAAPDPAVGIDGVDRVYNGTTVVGVDHRGGALSGRSPGDTVSLVAGGATGATADKNVGVDKPVTVGGPQPGRYRLPATTA